METFESFFQRAKFILLRASVTFCLTSSSCALSIPIPNPILLAAESKLVPDQQQQQLSPLTTSRSQWTHSQRCCCLSKHYTTTELYCTALKFHISLSIAVGQTSKMQTQDSLALLYLCCTLYNPCALHIANIVIDF